MEHPTARHSVQARMDPSIVSVSASTPVVPEISADRPPLARADMTSTTPPSFMAHHVTQAGRAAVGGRASTKPGILHRDRCESGGVFRLTSTRLLTTNSGADQLGSSVGRFED